MNDPKNKTTFLLINILALLFGVLLLIRAILEHDYIWAILSFVAFASLFVTFSKLFLRTGIFGFVHRKPEEMDERELILAKGAVQSSYAVFSIIVLSLFAISIALLSFGVNLTIFVEHTSILWIILVTLIYIAHTLPAIFVLLREKNPDFKEQK